MGKVKTLKHKEKESKEVLGPLAQIFSHLR